MTIIEYICGHEYRFDTEKKVLSIGDEEGFEMDVDGIKTLQNLFSLLENNHFL